MSLLEDLERLEKAATPYGYIVDVVADLRPNDLKLLNAAHLYMPKLLAAIKAAKYCLGGISGEEYHGEDCPKCDPDFMEEHPNEVCDCGLDKWREALAELEK